jgi:thiol-disulfide isomerase/thioredoxin
MRVAKILSIIVCAISLTLPAARAAAPTAAFTQPAFVAAQQAGKPILVEITASWCPTCAKQRPILSQLMNDPAFQNLVVYNVDFDTQKDIVRAMGAQMQSTLIVFHGAAEKGRSTGDTDAASIRALLEKSAS